MAAIWETKERTQTETPLFLFDFEWKTGAIERWSTHGVQVGGAWYEARVEGHNLFKMCSDADEGIDSLPKLSVTLANADSRCSQIERSRGWKGARVTVRFLFYDLKNGAPATETTVVFRGVAGPPERITEPVAVIPASNRMNLQRALLPEVRIQKRCPWKFPSTEAQREEAASGGARGRWSPFYRCGYSAGVAGGVGNLDGATPFTTCDYTRAQCEARGMFDRDGAGRETRRFGGVEFVPPSIEVRTHGEKSYHTSAAVENEARYNDFVPVVYGTAWYEPPIVFARNDGNLTRLEVLLGIGEVQDVLRVLVDDVEIPMGAAGEDMTATGWYNVVTHGTRTGAFNGDFTDANGRPLGDPYGSLAMMSVVVPNAVNSGAKLPEIKVLLRGLKLARYAANGAYLGDEYDNNPAWVILDILRRSGWTEDEIDLASFAGAAAYCGELIEATDLNGNAVWIPRFQCNLVLRRRLSVADVLRGVRKGSRLYLGFDGEGRVQLRVENTIALQQAAKPAGSNSIEPLNGGWPAYEFGDGTGVATGILRRANGEPSIRFFTRSVAESPNRISVEFQDVFNEYQQDSLSLVDVEDVLSTGHEVSAPLGALGLPNFHQAARMIQLQLDKSVRGNTYVEFETSMRGVGLRPGDIITLTYLKDGFLRQPFRIKSIAPGTNFETAVITAQIHNDDWYTDEADGSGEGRRRQPGAANRTPRPLAGSVIDENGEPQFGITEQTSETADGMVNVGLRVEFASPRRPPLTDLGIPLVSLAPAVLDEGGTLAGDQTLYYAVSAEGAGGSESALSFLVRATIPPGTDTNAVQLAGLSFADGTTGFSVYRGPTPAQLLRIAGGQALSTTFTDPGLAAELVPPPDESYDHANFYWRLEALAETAATIHSPDTVGNETLNLAVNALRGAVVRIQRGKGRGQERSIVSNTATTLTLGRPWDTEPDATSVFVVAEAGWRFGATTRTPPAEFDIPNRVGATVHVLGRSANAHNKECTYELSPLTRWRVGGVAGGTDADVPGRPVFGLHPTGQGSVELMGIGFEDLANTRTISAAMLALYYWPELASPCEARLEEAVGASDTEIRLAAAGGGQAGSLIQIGGEILTVTEKLDGGLRYRVERGVYGSSAESHAAGSPVFHLVRKVYILPFPKDFFGSPASGNHCFPIFLPDVRIACADLTVTNARGSSEPGRLNLTTTVDYGVRTLSGGQLSIQVEGYPAIQSNIAPPLVMEAAHAVRDVFAVVAQAPAGGPLVMRLRQDDDSYCELTIPAGATMSNVVDGFNLPPLRANAQIHLDVLAVTSGENGTPGRDLTVTLRL